MNARSRDDRGSIIPLVALGLVFLVTMVAFAIDLGNARQAKAQNQSTTDSAALAGAQALAGVTNGPTPPPGMSQQVYDAASWAFKNLGLPLPLAVTNCGGNAAKTCFSGAAGDTKNTSVNITTPFCPGGATPGTDVAKTCPPSSKTKPDGTAYSAVELLNVRTCWDEPTFVATVIGTASIRVCSEATARGTGTIASDGSHDSDNDPFARCDNPIADTANPNTMFDAAHSFPPNVTKDVAGKNQFGVTYLYTSDLLDPVANPDSVVVIFGSGDTAFTIGGQASANEHEFNAASPYVSVVFKNVDAQGRYKWEIKFTNYTTVNSSGVGSGAKNFRDTLPDGQYTFAVYAETNGSPVECRQEVWSISINNTKKANLGLCQEDLFRGGFGVVPSSGAQVHAGDTLVATYYDETHPFKPLPTETDPVILSHGLVFQMTGASGGDPQDLTILPGFSQTPGTGEGAPNGGNGEYKWKQEYRYVLPANLPSGQYVIEAQIYDSDQNKTGGDCGYAKWTINFSGQDGKVELVD